LIHVKANTAGSPHRQVFQISWKTIMKTDAQLQLDVIAELKWEPSVNAAQVGVKIKSGIVTLAGHVGRPTGSRARRRCK